MEIEDLKVGDLFRLNDILHVVKKIGYNFIDIESFESFEIKHNKLFVYDLPLIVLEH